MPSGSIDSGIRGPKEFIFKPFTIPRAPKDNRWAKTRAKELPSPHQPAPTNYGSCRLESPLTLESALAKERHSIEASNHQGSCNTFAIKGCCGGEESNSNAASLLLGLQESNRHDALPTEKKLSFHIDGTVEAPSMPTEEPNASGADTNSSAEVPNSVSEEVDGLYSANPQILPGYQEEICVSDDRPTPRPTPPPILNSPNPCSGVREEIGASDKDNLDSEALSPCELDQGTNGDDAFSQKRVEKPIYCSTSSTSLEEVESEQIWRRNSTAVEKDLEAESNWVSKSAQATNPQSQKWKRSGSNSDHEPRELDSLENVKALIEDLLCVKKALSNSGVSVEFRFSNGALDASTYKPRRSFNANMKSNGKRNMNSTGTDMRFGQRKRVKWEKREELELKKYKKEELKQKNISEKFLGRTEGAITTRWYELQKKAV